MFVDTVRGRKLFPLRLPELFPANALNPCCEIMRSVRGKVLDVQRKNSPKHPQHCGRSHIKSGSPK